MSWTSQRIRSNPLISFFAGGVGGSCLMLVGHPFDTIKVRIQTAPKPQPGQAPAFAGALDCLQKTISREGFFGLYKGLATPLAGVGPLFALFFFGCSIAKKVQQVEPNQVPTFVQNFNAGMFGGLLTTIIMAPGERIKCLLQVQQSKSDMKYTGPPDVLRQLYKEGGLRSIFRGTAATALRDIPASGIYIGAYEWLMVKLTPQGENRNEISILKTLLAGGITGIVYWIVAIPPDVLKSRLQIAPEGKYPNGIRDVFKELIREESIRSLYKGFAPVMLRAFPANAACFMGVEVAYKFAEIVLM